MWGSFASHVCSSINIPYNIENVALTNGVVWKNGVQVRKLFPKDGASDGASNGASDGASNGASVSSRGHAHAHGHRDGHGHGHRHTVVGAW